VTPAHLFALTGVALVAIGLLGVVAHRNLLRRVIGLNLVSSGVFLVLLGLAARSTPADPVPHALVLTGLVVGVSSTALLLALAVRLHRDTGGARVPEGAAGPARAAGEGERP
jgi:multicomponent Na+:H+ antiporter subunit C